MVDFNKVSSFENALSRGNSPLRMKFPFNSIILWLLIEFLEHEALSSNSTSWSWSINEVENSPVNSKNFLISWSSWKTLQCLILYVIEGMYLNSIGYLSWVNFGTVN